jgi:hypothetical protein
MTNDWATAANEFVCAGGHQQNRQIRALTAAQLREYHDWSMRTQVPTPGSNVTPIAWKCRLELMRRGKWTND